MSPIFRDGWVAICDDCEALVSEDHFSKKEAASAVREGGGSVGKRVLCLYCARREKAPDPLRKDAAERTRAILAKPKKRARTK